MSGGIVVREDVKVNSKEYAERLSTGAVVQELELVHERLGYKGWPELELVHEHLRYKRIRGSGPETGWVSTKLKGKELLVRHKLKVWCLSSGTRGDVQPYLALTLGMQRAGFSVAVWSNEDYEGFVKSYGVPFFPLFSSCEDLIKAFTSSGGGKVQKGLQMETGDFDLRLPWTRLCLSAMFGKRVNGASVEDPVPSEWESQALENPTFAYVVSEGYSRCAKEALARGDAALGERLNKTAERFAFLAPQTWLFPKCAVIVIHGGVGTLAAAWQSGVPLIVNPVWLDQFDNSLLNAIMGAGAPFIDAVDNTSPIKLGETIKKTLVDPEVQRGAQAVQLSMMRDNSLKTAIEYISKILTEEAPSGRWKRRWLPQG